MSHEEIYNALWATFEPHTRKMNPEQMAEFDGLVDAASRRLASETVGRDQVHKAMKRAGVQGLMIAKVFASL